MIKFGVEIIRLVDSTCLMMERSACWCQ